MFIFNLFNQKQIFMDKTFELYFIMTSSKTFSLFQIVFFALAEFF